MDEASSIFDLAVAWTWQYDKEFIQLLEKTSLDASLRVLLIDPQSVESVHEKVRNHSLHFRFFLDRASDESEQFQPLARLIQRRFREAGNAEVARPLNPLDVVARASDKATMHLELLSHNVNVPYTIIISPYNHKNEIEFSLTELAKLGRPFIIKPANTTGGGVGVVTGAESLKDVIEARQHHRNDKYLLQETIRPALLGSRRAWFRVFYAFGEAIPCWWDDQTHIYEAVEKDDREMSCFAQLQTTAFRIHEVCLLDFFSSELVITPEHKIVAVDYVNEMCDMRMQSHHRDGVPDSVVSRICRLVVQFIKNG
jgi:hypothetical protein